MYRHTSIQSIEWEGDKRQKMWEKRLCIKINQSILMNANKNV